MTRIVFLCLVLVNVVAFLWHGWLAPSMQAEHRISPLPHVQPLKLISQLTPAQKQALIKSATPPPTPEATAPRASPAPGQSEALACASYGPFTSSEDAHKASALLQKAGNQVSQHTLPGKVRLGYWVYLPPFGSRHEAEQAANMLKSSGIKDLYIVNDPANRNAISLGVFSDRYGALAHQKKIRSMGYHPLLTERFRDAAQYWLDAHGSEKQLPEAKAFADLAEGDVMIERQACKAGT
ncbi:MAG: SPOR domain-containing protein [Gammaproteobacteria bacterium]|nr:SPOR domain-containing protein [Gammaproteobacteria bacterium]MDE2346035.1 SPOR domain-containing protein [Gammaproteobacteria bacterium]